MVRRAMLAGLAVIFVFSLSGCATTKRNNEMEIQSLKNQVLALETQLRDKDEELNSLKEPLAKEGEELNANNIGEAKQDIDTKQIQLALKNADYYQGAIDGVMGKHTRRAIRAFQRANNLSADGKVGKNTWAILKEYLTKKVK